jgi:hypothetical protein
MGSGRWSTNIYDEHKRYKAASGKSTFDYSDAMHTTGRDAWRAHDSLNPKGVKMRESRDSAEHPDSTAVVVMFDVTGSMGGIPVTLQKKLPNLLGLLLRKGYVADPQILFGAIGDATCDSVPLQVGQFESDNRMDENLENFFLEGGGGGQQTESYELAMYFAARHTDIDCWSRRRHKGYLFIIGDEMAYPQVKKGEVQGIIADGLEANIPTKEILRELQERYHVFYILPRAASYGGNPEILGFWRKLLGQNVLELADPEAVCETIALTIGMFEGNIDLSTGTNDLKEFGTADKTLSVVTTTLANIPTSLMKVNPVGKLLSGLRSKAIAASSVKRI